MSRRRFEYDETTELWALAYELELADDGTFHLVRRARGFAGAGDSETRGRWTEDDHTITLTLADGSPPRVLHRSALGALVLDASVLTPRFGD